MPPPKDRGLDCHEVGPQYPGFPEYTSGQKETKEP